MRHYYFTNYNYIRFPSCLHFPTVTARTGLSKLMRRLLENIVDVCEHGVKLLPGGEGGVRADVVHHGNKQLVAILSASDLDLRRGRERGREREGGRERGREGGREGGRERERERERESEEKGEKMEEEKEKEEGGGEEGRRRGGKGEATISRLYIFPNYIEYITE